MRQLRKMLNRSLEYLIAAILVFITALVFVQVLLRVVNQSLIWAEELSRYLFIWLIFLATALGVYKKAHLSMDMLLDQVKGKTKRMLELFGSTVLVLFFACLGYYALGIVEIWLRKTSPILGLPMITVFLALPVSTALILFNLLGEIFENRKMPPDTKLPAPDRNAPDPDPNAPAPGRNGG